MKKIILSLFISLLIFTPAYSEISLSSAAYQGGGLIDDYIDMARLYTSSADYEKALEYIGIIEKLYPNNPKIMYEKAVILKNYNQPILARNLVREVAQLDPEYKDSYLYKEFFKDDLPGFYMPKNYDADYYKKKGEEAYNDGKYEKALEYFRKAINQKESVENLNNLAKAYIKTNNPKMAQKCFEEAINKDIKNPQTYINMALYYCDIEKNSKKQLHYLKQAIKINPDLSETYYQIGNVYFEKGMYETSVEYYRIATTKNDVFFDAYYALGSTLYKLQNYEEAYLVFQKTLEIELDNPKVYEFLAKSALELRKYDEAVSYINNAIAVEPSPDNYLTLAKALYQKGDYDKCINLLTTKISNSKNAEMYNYIGLCYFQKGNFIQALNNFNKAASVKEDPRYYHNLAACYNAMNDKTNMQINIDKAFNSKLNSPDDYIEISNIYLELNKTDDAISTLTKAISIYPNERKLYNKKLNLLEKTGKTKDAVTLRGQMNSKFPKETVYLGK